MPGRKTHEQQIRELERKPDYPDARREEGEPERVLEDPPYRQPKRDARQSEYPVSRHGMQQESRHDKSEGGEDET